MINPVIPGERPQIYTKAATAGNVTTSIAAGGGRKQRFSSLRVALTCDATVANRQIKIEFLDSAGNAIGPALLGTIITAGLSGSFVISGLVSISGGVTLPNDTDYVFFPGGIWLDGELLNPMKVTIVNGVAGDSYTIKGFYEEMSTG